MLRNNIIYLFFLLPVLSSCIKPFDPEIRKTDSVKYVVSGQINDGEELQSIEISSTSNLETAGYLPEEGCTVEVVASTGERFAFVPQGNGLYKGRIAQSYFVPGAGFKVEIITAAGDNLVSAYDYYVEGPELGNISWEVDTLVSNGLAGTVAGLRFFTDLEASMAHSRLYRWEVIETWEYHADYPLIWYYDGHVQQVWPPDYSRKVCWKTEQVPYVFTLNTNSLTENRFQHFPLHFVSSRTSRLAYGYSVEIRQHALSEAAFAYWERMRLNNEQNAGLFEQQPVPVRGNLTNVNGSKEVLGFFGVGSMRKQRLFVEDSQGLTLDFSTFCNPNVLLKGLREIRPYDYPAYLQGDQFGYSLVLLNEECVNCLALGGTNVKPDFWPR
ncbi:MAG TPA: DUF4249 domain-containing protein [Bacteroidales bacterium]|nr:DUF4249 domain-containing protein [Bacteroidales bacterium]HQQ11895.1 DUF4249 domain-containing protein [Bacteroidales bacterium]